jgi:nuclear cap-binding protein subunit 1
MCAQVDVCKLMATFPRSMSACVRECFARMPVLDPELRARLADWLAYHLSNFEFMWPWDKWKAVLAAPPHDPQRCAHACTMLSPNRLSSICLCSCCMQLLPTHFPHTFVVLLACLEAM